MRAFTQQSNSARQATPDKPKTTVRAQSRKGIAANWLLHPHPEPASSRDLPAGRLNFAEIPVAPPPVRRKPVKSPERHPHDREEDDAAEIAVQPGERAPI